MPTALIFAIAVVALTCLSGSPVVAGRILLILLPVVAGIAGSTYLFVLLAIFFHELGHLVGGLLVGFEFRSVTIGPLEVVSKEGRLLARPATFGKTGGFIRMQPRAIDRLPFRFAVFVAAGPLFSLILAAGAWRVYGLASEAHAQGLLQTFWAAESMTAFAVALAVLPGALLPFTSSTGSATDMKVLLTLARPNLRRDRYISLLLLAHELSSGLRARDWTRSYCEVATSIEDGDPEEIRARLMAYYHYYDRGLVDQALRHLDRGEEVAASLGKKRGWQGDAVLHEAAFAAVLLRRRGDLAEQKLRAIGESASAFAGIRHEIQAAIAADRGLVREAEREFELAEEALRSAFVRYGGNLDFEVDRLEKVRNLNSPQALESRPDLLEGPSKV